MDQRPQVYRTHPAILANLPAAVASQPEPRAAESFELLLEQHLEAQDRVELAYRLNEYETNGCDLSELLSYLMQSLLIKLPSLMIKYKLLSYIKQLYVEPKLSAEEEQQQQCFRQQLRRDQDQEVPLDLRLFDATIRRYLLASHQLLSRPQADELRRRRRQRRAAELRNQLFSPQTIDYRSGSSSPATPRALRPNSDSNSNPHNSADTLALARPQDDRLLAPDAADTCGLMETKTSQPYQSHLSPVGGRPDALNQPGPALNSAWPHSPPAPYRGTYSAGYRHYQPPPPPPPLCSQSSSSWSWSPSSARPLGASLADDHLGPPLSAPPDDIDNELDYLAGSSMADDNQQRYPTAPTKPTNADFQPDNGLFKGPHSRQDHANDRAAAAAASQQRPSMSFAPLLSLGAATFAGSLQHLGDGNNNSADSLNEFSAAGLPLEALERLARLEMPATPPGGARGGRRAPATTPCGNDFHCAGRDDSAGAFFVATRAGLSGLTACSLGARHQLGRCCSVPCEWEPPPLGPRGRPHWPAEDLAREPPPPRPFQRSCCPPPPPPCCYQEQPQHWQLAADHNNYNQAHKKYGPPLWGFSTTVAGAHLLTSASLPSSPIANDKLGAAAATTYNWPAQRHFHLQRHRHRGRHNHHHHHHHHGHHSAPHQENSAQFWPRPPANQLKDYRGPRMGLVAIRNEDDGASEEEEEEEAEDGYGQYDDRDELRQDQTEEDQEEVLLVPSQARGRLRMSVAEQMKEQANSFVRSSKSPRAAGAVASNASSRHSKRQKPQLQVRRTLKVKIKKSKPILGIAIEGGFNVSGQLLPRIVCVHEEGAAYQCGKLRASDLILEVNGHSTVNMTHDEIAKTIANAYYQDPRPYIEFLIGESVNV